MSNGISHFNVEKTREAILYLSHRYPKPTVQSLAKLLYLADKTSLEGFGNTISGDVYYAMEYGPVPYDASSMINAAENSDAYGFHVDETSIIIPDRPADLTILTDADVETLNRILCAYSHCPLRQLRQLSHDQAWQKAWAAAAGRHCVRMPRDEVVSVFDNETGQSLDLLREARNPEEE